MSHMCHVARVSCCTYVCVLSQVRRVTLDDEKLRAFAILMRYCHTYVCVMSHMRVHHRAPMCVRCRACACFVSHHVAHVRVSCHTRVTHTKSSEVMPPFWDTVTCMCVSCHICVCVCHIAHMCVCCHMCVHIVLHICVCAASANTSPSCHMLSSASLLQEHLGKA